MTDVFTVLGWTWLLATIATTAVGLGLAAWRTFRPAAKPQAQHRIAAGAFVVCLGLVALAPLALSSNPALVPPRPSAPTTPDAVAAAAAWPRQAGTSQGVAPSGMANTVAAVAGAGWLLGAIVMAAQLLGGWIVVRRLAYRARPSESVPLIEATARLGSAMGVRAQVQVRESVEVDVPVVVGYRPILIVPPDLVVALTADALQPLLAHELAHVVRRDYLMNLLQTIGDAVLGACPGGWWVSRRVRETREYCCDEMAAQVCGDRRRYAEALSWIATLSTSRQPVVALGVGGPRLAARIRRLLHGDTDAPHKGVRLLASLASIALLIGSGSSVLTLAASQVANLQTTVASQPVAGSGQAFEVLMNYVFDQPGSGVALTRAVAGANFACDSARVRNNANVAVTGLAFVAVVTLDGALGPVQIYSTDLIPVNLAPAAETDVNVHLLAQTDYGRLGWAVSKRVVVMCALSKVTYSNGFGWEVTPNPAARTADAALSLPPAEVSRSLVSANTPTARECRDDRGGTYSEGALVPIRNEPGTFARCILVSPPHARERLLTWRDYGVALR